MNLEIRENYLKWSYSFENWKKNKKIYDKLFVDVKSTKNKKLEPGVIGVPDSFLCLRNRIAKILLKKVRLN